MKSNDYQQKFLKETSNKHFLIKGIFEEEKNKNIFQKENVIFDNPNDQISYIYLGSKKEFNYEKLIKVMDIILFAKERNYQVDVSSFLTTSIDENEVIKCFIYQDLKNNGKSFNLKTTKIKSNKNHCLKTKENFNKYQKIFLIANQMNEIRYLQDSAPNILTINKMVDYAKELVRNNKKLKMTILNHFDLSKLKMNLINSVNQGSYQKAKVIVIEYMPQKTSKNKISFVGKGIIFDSGGYNLKTGRHMLDMKFDMSGAAIALLLVDTISKLNISKNISCVIPLTDNLVDSNAQVPESIWTSMSGKTVEVANTDAEGRLILADAITYSAKVLKSNLIIDLATLTGTILYSLGKYTGVWSTSDSYWEQLNDSAKQEKELIWRMPLDNLYIANLNKNTFADTFSCSNTEYPDSNIAAAWLNQFALNQQYIHLDIAGIADTNSQGTSPMFKTLINFVTKIKWEK